MSTGSDAMSNAGIAGCSRDPPSSSEDLLPLPPGWIKGFSKSQQRFYYCHPASKHTQWHFPTATEAQDPRLAKKRIQQAAQTIASKTADSYSLNATATNISSVVSTHTHRPSSKRPPDASTTSLGSLLGDITGTVKVLPPPAPNTQTQETKRQRLSSSGKDAGFGSPNSAVGARTGTESVTLKTDSDATCVAIIVPYRDIHVAQNRARHLKLFIPHMHEFLQKQLKKGTLVDYHIYIVEQSNDNRKFNRGKLLNIGFDIARKNKCRKSSAPRHDVFIFHDVDLLPGDDLGSSYTKFPTVPLHIARVWDRYSNNPKYFGGIVSFSESDMKRINGYPNTFWGWGGEDDEMQKRCEKLGIQWDSPRKGTIQDLEDMNLQEKLTFLKNHRNWKCMVKWEALKEHESTWRQNGLADLKYSILKMENLDSSNTVGTNATITDRQNPPFAAAISRATKITVDVKLNGNHWSNEKSGMDFVWNG